MTDTRSMHSIPPVDLWRRTWLSPRETAELEERNAKAVAEDFERSERLGREIAEAEQLAA